MTTPWWQASNRSVFWGFLKFDAKFQVLGKKQILCGGGSFCA
jgi:hypothetical protein